MAGARSARSKAGLARTNKEKQMAADEKIIDKNFSHHVVSEAKGVLLGEVRANLRLAAKLILIHVPAGREQSLAITKLEEAMFWANAGIARADG